MLDSFGRKIDYVRLSITDRCNLRCSYCIPSDCTFMPLSQVLTLEEIKSLGLALKVLGITKIKLTGGEPQIRSDLPEIISYFKQELSYDSVTLTTNGQYLMKTAETLKLAGLDAINISLDTINHNRYQAVTSGGHLDVVLAGIEKCLELDFKNIKLNSVLLAPLVEQDLIDLIEYIKDKPISLRFIEMMPIGPAVTYERIIQEEIIDIVKQHYGDISLYEEKLGNGPASYYSIKNFKGKLGFISAIGHCFCPSCNRIRI